MKPGGQPGDYSHETAKGEKSCTVTAYLCDGRKYAPQVLRID